MGKKILNVVRSGYRATLEEQDDPILWLTQAMHAAKADADVLLSGNAVGYVVAKQDASGLAFGDWRQTQPPRLADGVAALVEGGASVFYNLADARARGIEPGDVIAGLSPVETESLAELVSRYDLVLNW